jgi:PAS domain S-box-containing protein
MARTTDGAPGQRSAGADGRSQEERARASEADLVLALEAGHMGIFSFDLATQEIRSTPTFAELHGRPSDVTNLHFEESLANVHPDDRGLVRDVVARILRSEVVERIVYRVVWPDGSIRWIELVGRTLADDEGRPQRATGVCIDVTERTLAYRALEQKEEMLRRLIEVQENEKFLLCHEFHDGLIQWAFGARMLLEGCRHKASPGWTAEESQIVDTVIDCLGRGIEDGRRVIRGIRPGVLDDLGLEAALHDLADQLAAVGVSVDVRVDPAVEALSGRTQTTLYRVVQEALSNIRRHSGADRCTVELVRTAAELVLSIRDGGAGFDPAARTPGFGLMGMVERMRLAGGSCRIDSAPAAGTTVTARLPLPAAVERTANQPAAPDHGTKAAAGRGARGAAVSGQA